MGTKLLYMYLLVICMLGLLDSGVCQALLDPCTNYTLLDDDTLLTTYTLNHGDPNICRSMGNPGWYRYNTTIDGTISTTCPTGTQCGTDSQIWVNGDTGRPAPTSTSITTSTSTMSKTPTTVANSPRTSTRAPSISSNFTSMSSNLTLSTSTATSTPTLNSTAFLNTMTVTQRSRAPPSPRFGFVIITALPVFALLMSRS